MKGKAKFKLVKKGYVLLCSHCSTIIKYAKDFTEEEILASKGKLKISPQLCDICEEKRTHEYE